MSGGSGVEREEPCRFSAPLLRATSRRRLSHLEGQRPDTDKPGVVGSDADVCTSANRRQAVVMELHHAVEAQVVAAHKKDFARVGGNERAIERRENGVRKGGRGRAIWKRFLRRQTFDAAQRPAYRSACPVSPAKATSTSSSEGLWWRMRSTGLERSARSRTRQKRMLSRPHVTCNSTEGVSERL